MKAISWLVSLGLTATATQTITFDSLAPGRMPSGWTTTMTNSGSSPKWEILKDITAPSPPCVLAQVSKDATRSRFPLAILDRFNFKDGEVSVKFKPVSGKEDRAAGLVWRYRDPNNYYIVRANALANDIVLYKVENGQHMPLALKGARVKAYGVKHAVPSNLWSTLKVAFRGPLFSVYLNHRRVFEVEDTTFNIPGKVGLWTKADSVTYFDNFRVVER